MSSDSDIRALIERADDLTAQSKAKILANLRELQTRFGGPRTLAFVMSSPDKLIPELEKQGWSNHRLCGVINAPLSVFKRSPQLRETFAAAHKTWQDRRQQAQKLIDEHYDKSEGSEKFSKCAIPWSDLINGRDKLPKGNRDRLLICMYTMIPPSRADYGAVKVFRRPPGDNEVGEHENYLVLGGPTESYVGLRRYKTDSTYGENKIPLPKELAGEIEASLKECPREWLFTGKDGGPFACNNSFTKHASRVLERVYKKPGLSLTILRRMYVSKQEDPLHEKSWSERKQIAKAMGHSPMCQASVYYVKPSSNK